MVLEEGGGAGGGGGKWLLGYLQKGKLAALEIKQKD